MFKWVVQSNIKEEDYTNFAHELELQGVEYYSVRSKPFTTEIEPDLDLQGKVFVYGSSNFGDVAKAKGWIYFDKNLDSEVLLHNYKERMLSHSPQTRVSTFANAQTDLDEFFIRPCSDKKEFSGTTMTKTEFIKWRNQIELLNYNNDDYCSLTMNDRILIAPLVEISEEYRFFVVDGEPVTWSTYRKNNQVYKSPDVPLDAIEYVKQALSVFCPDRAFVIDIAMTQGGYKIIECNSINSSGFYCIDIAKFISAINNMPDMV